MKIHIKQKAILTLLLLNLLIMNNSVVYAAEHQMSVELAVKQTIEYENTATEQFNKTGTYELTGLTEEAPMPEGSEHNAYAFSIDGVDETVKIPMVYTHGGMYQYQLTQTTKKQDAYTYDETKYKITVYVKNSENGGLVAEVMAENGSGKKCGEITFLNKYERKGDTHQQGKDTVKTSDETTMSIWLLMLGCSAFMILFIGTVKKRNRIESKCYKGDL